MCSNNGSARKKNLKLNRLTKVSNAMAAFLIDAFYLNNSSGAHMASFLD